MSGELGLAGYRFQYHVILLSALELWTAGRDGAVDAIVVEGRPGENEVDYELVGRDAGDTVIVQVKGRWGRQPRSAPEIVRLLMELGGNERRSVRLELVANGTFSGPAQQLVQLLARAPGLDDHEMMRALRDLKVSADPSAEMLAVLRRATVTVRSEGLAGLRDEVRVRLRRLRAARRDGIGDQAAEMLRAYLLSLAMDKTEASDVPGRTLSRDEFLAAVGASREVLEDALLSRWGVPVGLAHRDSAVPREALLNEVGVHLTDEQGVHTADGRVRTCVLAGPAGIGKTTVAHQYALDNAAEFDWIYQLTAGADDDAASVDDVLREELEQFATWLSSRGVRTRSAPAIGLREAAQAVSEALAACSQSWLLIIDNVAAADTIASILPPAGHGAVLITTRNSAWQGSQPVITVGELTAEQGHELMRRRVTGITIDDVEIGELCQRLDLLPLNLVTAASYLRSTREPVRRFLDGLADEVERLETLNFPLQHLEDYPRTAVAAVNLAMRRLHAGGDELSTRAVEVLQRASVVFPDRIPTDLLATDRQGFNSAVALLHELSLITRWQDHDQHDWARVHRIIQDVVRADLNSRPTDLHAILRQVESITTDLMHDCIARFDLVTGAALRLHALTLADRLQKQGLQQWQTTTALLANAAMVARIQGHLTEAQQLLEQALELIPLGDYDPHIAGRRGRTLAALAQLLLDRNDSDAARAALEQARRAHDIHRFIKGHEEGLVECMAMQCQLEAHMSHDEQYIREQFDKAYSLPEVTPEAAMARAGCLVKIARDMDWRARRRTRYEENAERLLALVQESDYPQPIPTAMAHMCLAETHGSDGGIDAAWRHYRRAQEILAKVTGLDPAFPSDEAVELAAGLLGVILDDNTGAPHDDIDQLVRRILADVEQRLHEVDWSATQRDWVAIRLQAVKTLRAAVNGEQDNYYECLDTVQRLVDTYEPQLPSNVAYIVSLAPELENFMRLQHVRICGPEVGVYLSSTLTAPATPQHTPAPCHHFDPQPPRTPSPAHNTSDNESPEERDEHSQNKPTLEIDRARAVSRHGELLLRQERNHGVDDQITAQLTAVVRSACGNPQEALDHLIGAWRLIDTMAHGLSRITGHTLAETRDALDRELIRVHHDDNTDTVPARVALRCLNNNWWPELNDMLSGITQEVMAETLTTLLDAEHHLAAQYATLQGREVVEIIEHTIEAAVSFDSVSVHRVERTYDSATGTIAVARDMLGEESRICLHDPQAGGVEHVFILGDEQWGKSSSLRVVILQAAISSVFCVFPADPRNEHNFPQLWQSFVDTPAWIATNVADTLRNLEAMSRMIDFRSGHTGFGFPVNGAPGILFALDDADDVLAHPRGRALIERIVVDGPRVCVGMAVVIRDLDSLTNNEHLLRAVTSTPNKMYFGANGSEVLQNLRSTPSS